MSNFIHDVIKIKYSELGFLPDYPYHLISDEEMFQAFLNEEEDDYFHMMYPCVDDALAIEYRTLVQGIQIEIDKYLAYQKEGTSYTLPNWIYSYMMGEVTGPNSSQLDKHDLFTLLGTDNIDDAYTKECATACYEASSTWLSKYTLDQDDVVTRPFTMFGEPHVYKYLRLQQVDALRSEDENAVSSN